MSAAMTDEEFAAKRKEKAALLQPHLAKLKAQLPARATDFQQQLLTLGKLEAVEDFYVELLSHFNQDASLPADLKEALNELAEVLAESKRLRARGPRGKAKSGRPGIWKSDAGRHLIAVVERIKASRPIGRLHAPSDMQFTTIPHSKTTKTFAAVPTASAKPVIRKRSNIGLSFAVRI
jgi:hypothetical protein